jgi:6-phosphogluconate dehydrogenase
MGQNLALNFSCRGFSVAVFNRKDAGEEAVTDAFISARCQEKKIVGASNVESFVNSIKLSRKILLMVNAGTAVDEVIEQLTPFLDLDDIIIDCGNSHYRDTIRRLSQLGSRGIHFVGCGISGGQDGALKGPSVMPGGSFPAWEKIKHMLQAIAAKNENGDPCCDWIGPEGSGHFVKMIHNGIEYALMQIIAEVFDIMKRMLFMSTDEINNVFLEWNKGELNSYLLEITTDILKLRDENGQPLIDNILDYAYQKGTGKDACIAALELGVPATGIIEAIDSRFLSAMVNERHQASHEFISPMKFTGDPQVLLKAMQDAMYCSQLIAYTQGFSIIDKASKKYAWNIDLSKIAQIWGNGCIIQSDMLNGIWKTLKLKNENQVLMDSFFVNYINKKQAGWRYTIIVGIQHGIPVPALSSSVSYFDGLRSEYLPANLIQAQRHYFGAHGYVRRNAPAGAYFNPNEVQTTL